MRSRTKQTAVIGKIFLLGWIIAAGCVQLACAERSNDRRQVVLIVWDGMRPDFVSEENTPALWRLPKQGPFPQSSTRFIRARLKSTARRSRPAFIRISGRTRNSRSIRGIRINAGRERRCRDFSRARINRVMIAEKDPCFGKSPKPGVFSSLTKSGTHPIPDDQNYLPAIIRFAPAHASWTQPAAMIHPSRNIFPNHGSLLCSAPHRFSITGEPRPSRVAD